jgi:hypothetical protein
MNLPKCDKPDYSYSLVAAQNVFSNTEAVAWGCLGTVPMRSIVHDLREILRQAQGRKAQPTAALFAGRTLQSTPESGKRAGWDGHKHNRGAKVPMAVDTLGHQFP